MALGKARKTPTVAKATYGGFGTPDKSKPDYKDDKYSTANVRRSKKSGFETRKPVKHVKPKRGY